MNRVLLFTVLFVFVLTGSTAYAAPDQVIIPGMNLNIGASGEPQDVALTIRILLLLTVLSIAPAILIMMTCFTRIIIVLSFLRNALATQQMPPNQVLIGLAFFMTLFIMGPTISQINETAFQPYVKGELSQQEAYDKATIPIKEFMAKHTREKDLALFAQYDEKKRYSSIQEIPLTTLVPAYAISELKTGFQMGFLLFLPFLVIDMVVASILMAMGMMMLPPVMISLPFKILLFVLVDGWYLVVKSLLLSF
ncbi:flagellar type III secretion system pore protein FliP [Ammoniphilus resinae]|uniref:Flagellar biosynthetic protein FliP n=1 Tax=Ammoniphilus resinae TaxID=861532 RepID=A0ABS4GKL1_9BACL|nr:flagellar type III secretion system pore protein FliP [Ammoniphilus resinae]MBP1930795.1 flagellar biosynthetic protein FliP [Ammoniphilus resinae]